MSDNPNTNTPHISVTDLAIGWGDRLLIEHATFSVKRASCFAILGGSGCGKSSLLRHLIGLEQPKAGTIHIDGLGDPLATPGAPGAPGAPGFGVMFQSGALFGSMNLLDNCLLPLQAWTHLTPREQGELARAKLELVGLGPFTNLLPGEISGGMKKRAGIARAMVLEPDLLFFDEPSAGLDPISAVELDDLIRSLIDDLGITVVLVTHELPSIYRIVDDCIVLDKEARGIVAHGKPAALRDLSELPFVHHFFNRTSPTTTAQAAARVHSAHRTTADGATL